MTRGVVVCLAVIACAPPVQSPKPMTAAEILRETADTYAHAKSYVDHGKQLLASSNAKHARSNVRLTFTTAFVRGGPFRFEYLNYADPGQAVVTWSDGVHTLGSWAGVPSSLPSALNTLAGISSGTTQMIPPLLLPNVGRRDLTAIPDATLGRDEAVDGNPCWQITGKRANGTITLWIDKQSHLIRQVEEQFALEQIASGSTAASAIDQITRYEPLLDTQVGASLLAPPASPAAATPASEPAWLGVMFEGHSGSTRVQSVVSGGPAEHAGMRAGDVITKIDSQQVAKAADVIARVRNEKVGTRLHVTISRPGKEVALDITLEKRPDLDELQARLVDHPAPDFALAPLTGGGSAKLADLKGHVVIVDFWATWCGPCAMAMPHLVDLAHKYKDLRVVGISDEEATDIKQYVADHKIDYTIARDADDAVTGHYLVTGLPTLVIIDKTGVVRALHIGAGDFDAIEAEVQQYSK